MRSPQPVANAPAGNTLAQNIASLPATQPVAETTPPKPAGPRTLANTPITPVPWFGARRGQAAWSGVLAPGARLVLGSNGIQEGGGQLTVQGGSLPTVEMEVSGMVPDLTFQVLPATRAQRIVITNNGSSPVDSLRFNWSVKLR